MYRNIVTIQIHHLPDSLKDADRSVQREFLDKRLEEKFKTSPQLTYYTNQFKSYLANKDREQQIVQEMPQIIERIYAANKAVVHRFRLVPKR